MQDTSIESRQIQFNDPLFKLLSPRGLSGPREKYN